MFGWDYPPGVRESDIPGCRPEDEEVEVVLTLTVGELEDIDYLGIHSNDMETVVEQIQARPKHQPLRIRRKRPWWKRWRRK